MISSLVRKELSEKRKMIWSKERDIMGKKIRPKLREDENVEEDYIKGGKRIRRNKEDNLI